MGRTLLPFRPAFDKEIQSWTSYRRGLRLEDQPIFDELIQYARSHVDAGSLAARPLLSEVLFISIILEQHKLIKKLEKSIDHLRSEISHLKKT